MNIRCFLGPDRTSIFFVPAILAVLVGGALSGMHLFSVVFSKVSVPNSGQLVKNI